MLVIEYGPLDKLEPGVLVPGLPPPAEYSRNYVSVPQPGLLNQTQPVVSAAVVGGGSVINGMFFNRGSAADYNSWENLGNPGWGWNGLLPYFKKSENFTPPPEELASEYPISSDRSPHGTNGPVGSGFPPFQYPVLKYFFRAWNSVGISTNPQPNNGQALGAFYSPLSLDAWNESRSSSDTAHYRPITGKRQNFHLLTLHAVTTIQVNKSSKQATGVKYASRSKPKALKFVKANKEVIIAAGAPRTPGLLQLSGIGPKKLLSGLGIDVIEDLPGVGYNFHDQPATFTGVTYDFSKYPYPTPDWLNANQSFSSEQLALYYKNRTGAYTLVYNSGTTVAFLPLQNITNQYEQIIKDAQKVDLSKILPAGADYSVLNGYKAQQKLILQDYASPNAAVHESGMTGQETIPLVLLKPLSRGSIVINSTDPFADPVFDYGTFQHPTDVAVAVAVFKKFRQFVNSKVWKAVGLAETNPGPTVQGDEAIEAALRKITHSTWSHPVGTAGMRPREQGGVVDAQLRVYGIKGLSVVDASIFPIIPATHTSSTVYAVAEKAADLIKARA